MLTAQMPLVQFKEYCTVFNSLTYFLRIVTIFSVGRQTSYLPIVSTSSDQELFFGVGGGGGFHAKILILNLRLLIRTHWQKVANEMSAPFKRKAG